MSTAIRAFRHRARPGAAQAPEITVEQSAGGSADVCVEWRRLDELKARAINLRKHPHGKQILLAASMREHGYINPIIIDENNEVLAGALRATALKDLAVERV